MGRYRKVDPRSWKDEKVRKLDPLGKLIFLYAITGQSNRIGCFTFSPGMAAEDTGLSVETVQERLRQVCQTLRWEWDEHIGVVCIPTWWKYNQPENPNVLKGNLRDLDELPDSPLVVRFSENLRDLDENLHETFAATVAKRLGKRRPNQEQEQEQEQDRSPAPPRRGGHPRSISGDEADTSASPQRSTPKRPRRRGHCPLTAEQQQRFTTFWRAYPRKEAKHAAMLAFPKLDPDDTLLSTILADIERRLPGWRRDLKFVPHASTYLNNRRWEDEPLDGKANHHPELDELDEEE